MSTHRTWTRYVDGRVIEYTKPEPAWWTELRRLHAEGRTDSEIAAALNKPTNTVGCARRALGLPINKRK